MHGISQWLRLDQPATYLIRVQGRLDPGWSSGFEGLSVTAATAGGLTRTTLTGMVADQVALHSLLARIRDLGLPLLSVEYIEGTAGQDSAQTSSHPN